MTRHLRTRLAGARRISARLLVGCAATLLVSAEDGARLRPGVFLYASPELGDPNFARSVVLLVRYEPEKGAMGLIVNRPGDLDAKTALPALAGMPMYEGGPVETEAMLALVRTRRPSPDAVRVLDDVYLTGRNEDLEAAASGGRAWDRVRVFSGYAGWSPGQLEREVKLGGWVIAPGDAAAVFSRQPEALWRKVNVLMRRRET